MVQFVSATNTDIKIKTLPSHEVQVTPFDPLSSDFKKLGTLIDYSDEYGDASFIYSSDNPAFNLIIFIKKDNEKIIDKKYLDNFIAGDSIYIELAPEGFEFLKNPADEVNITNETNSSEEFENQSTNNTGATITGSTIFGDEGFLSEKIIYSIIGVIILVLLMGFILLKIMERKLNNSKEIKVKKVKLIDENNNQENILNPSIKKDEQMKKSENNVGVMENTEGKIKEARNNLIKYQRELMRLRRGE
jgi:hypothetical protein